MKNIKIIFMGLAIFLITASGAIAAEEQSDISADQAVVLLNEGNQRFVSMEMARPNLSIARRKEAAVSAQKPFAVVLACADSRVPVEDIFDRGIGDIFVIRVAGNIAMDSAVIGSAEYAVGHLGAPLVIVMGHTGCGAVKAAISGPLLEGSIRDIQKKIAPVAFSVKAKHPGLKGALLENAVEKANAVQGKRDILLQSAEIRHMAVERKVRLMAAIYNIETGKVEWIK